MATMFPKVFPKDSKSSGEKKVFEFFRKNAPNEWYVLHSFRLPNHKKVVFGEADFIVIAPGYGVFVLEVKSGGVGFDGTNWIFTNRIGEKNRKIRGPFEQGRDAMFEVEKILVEKSGDKFSRLNIQYGYGVIFTDERNFPKNVIVEDEPWRLQQNDDKNEYCKFIKSLSRNFQRNLKDNKKKVPSPLERDTAKEIAKILRPIVDCIVPLKSFILASEEDIVVLTDEQLSVMDDIEENERIVILGSAGTGKTVIAMEDAKRSAGDGNKVGFFCYNKRLAEHVRANISGTEIEVQTFHSYMNKHYKYKPSEVEAVGMQKYFLEVLPKKVASLLNNENYHFDKIIVDEFQDLCTTHYLELFNAILKGGLCDGRFSFYGDFIRQSIFDDTISLSILDDFAWYAKKRLTINCRNTKNIGNELHNITGFEDEKYKLKIPGEPVDYLSWHTSEEQIDKLKAILKELKERGFNGESIVVLSPVKREKSIVGLFDEESLIIGDFGHCDDASPYLALYSTVQAFKGLESKIVILCDINDYSNEKLMYVALSRARSKMFVLESTGAATERKKMLIRRNV